MAKNETSNRKKEHIQLCLTDKVAYAKSSGFDEYEFEHYAITEVDYKQIDLSTKFFQKRINYPFLISCMTGGTTEAEKINEKLAIAACELNIPIGVGSQRQALENNSFHESYKIIRKNAGSVPVIGNIGAAQAAFSSKLTEEIQFLIDLVEADAMVIHVNPLQELLQKEGEPNFSGLLKNIKKLTRQIKTPIIVKEVGSGISKSSAKKLIDAGVKGIDVAGAGGTSWAAVELLRSKAKDDYFKEWGMPTTYCVRTVRDLKKKHEFMLIASGGINSGIDIAKSIALGADLAASARPLLKEVMNKDAGSVIQLLKNWFDDLKKVMYLTGSPSINKLHKSKIHLKREMI